MRGVFAFVVCLGLLVACSDSSGPTDPSDPGTEDPIEDPTEDPDEDPDTDPDGDPDDPDEDPDDEPIVLTGTWSYGTAELTDPDSGATCTIDEATMEVSGQDGDTFTGTATGVLTCEVEDQDWTWDREAALEGGALNGDEVEFVFSDLNSEAERADVVHEGTIDGDTMSGTATLFYTNDGEDFELTGDWTATRDE